MKETLKTAILLIDQRIFDIEEEASFLAELKSGLHAGCESNVLNFPRGPFDNDDQ